MKYEEFIYSKTCTYIIMFCDVMLTHLITLVNPYLTFFIF